MKFERIGKVIKRSRIGQGLTQHELARRTGICRATVIAIEQGKTLPRYDKMVKINELLKIASS